MRIGIFYLWKYGFWFRIFGYGLCVAIDSPVLFSERVGVSRKVLRVGRVKIELLMRG